MDGTEPWPMIVADAIIADRNGDGAGDPDRVLPLNICTKGLGHPHHKRST